METVIVIVHVCTAMALIGLVLLHRGKGADAGASFGSGASQTVFGSRGSANFLGGMTASLAVIFFLTSFGLAMLAKQKADSMLDIGVPTEITKTYQKAPVSNTDAPIVDEAPIDSSDAPTVKSSARSNGGASKPVN
ncbi:MAG: preprotein translocase subunit SecG [Endozoicomonadaceae bacterium]|nr:preprotein translocase subunit SecG [Endozoicomonadaceae bacterium]